ncbi:MAG: purine-nucleoside phosphorylase [Candidatus Omnitrophica bacterium]|nr:purine-nucleoside phosphorylase [Candidatus Omnitrophota bacterium]
MILKSKIEESAGYIRKFLRGSPEIGIILGTGLGNLAAQIQEKIEIDYGQIPNFTVSTSIGHRGVLVAGKVSGRQVIAMEGRFHYYEGYTMQEVTYPVRVMKALGANTLIVSNAAGGMNPDYESGDLMIISDHINLMGDNPLRGPNDDSLGPRFPDMIEPYNDKLARLAESIAKQLKIKVHKGVYVGVAGPNLETRAEYRFLRNIGADAVGMSTVPEVIVAVHMGMKVLGISCITDECIPETLKPLDIEKVLAVAKKSEPVLSKLVMEVIKQM